MVSAQRGARGEAAGQAFDLASEPVHQHGGPGLRHRATLVGGNAAYRIGEKVQVTRPDQSEGRRRDDAENDADQRRGDVGPSGDRQDGECDRRHSR